MNDATLRTRLGAAIRERRTELGFSQETFADSIRMHRAYYSTIERGERNLTMATLNRVAIGLTLPLSQLLAKAGL